MSSPSHQTIPEMLRWRADQHPERDALIFLGTDGQTEEVVLTYGQLHQRSCVIGASLQPFLKKGMTRASHILLLFQHGHEFFEALCGTLYAGAVALPSPVFARPEQQIAWLDAIIESGRPAVILTSERSCASFDPRVLQELERHGVPLLMTDALDEKEVGATAHFQFPTLRGSDLAFLLYTSGSTATPRGAMIPHQLVLDRVQFMCTASDFDQQTTIVNWLPLGSTFSLTVFLFPALYVGGQIVSLPTRAFLHQPVRLLEAISHYRAQACGGTCLTYEHCLQRVPEQQRATLRLDCWGHAIVGGEPIRQQSLEEFARAFAPCGFRWEAFCPTYGTTEAGGAITWSRPGQGVMLRSLAAPALAHQRVVPAQSADQDSRQVVGCGHAWSREMEVLIVNPTTFQLCPAEEVGEIWLPSKSSASGYWGEPEASAQTFEAQLADGTGPFCRTGDLGFMDDADELFITGRIDELVISHGQNHYPQDIEQTVASSHPLLIPGGGVAFGVAEEGEEQLVLVHEVSTPLAHPQEIFGAIRQAVAARHGLHTSRILLIPAGSLPRISVGKIQRRLVREDYLAGRLGVVLASSVRVERGGGPPSAARTGDGTPSSGEEASHTHLLTYLRELSAQLLRVDSTELDEQQPVAELGLDSLTSLEVTHRIEQDLGVLVGPEAVLGGSIAELADQIGAKREADAADRLATFPQLRQVGSQKGTRLPLSYQEEQLWYLAQETPWSTAYNETIRLHLVGHLNRDALERSLNDVVRRQAALRTTFALQADGPARVVSPHAPLSLTEVSLDPSTSLDHLCCQFGQRPFDLATGPLYRLALVQVAEHHHVLLLSLHHSIMDGQSWRILLQDLAALYQAHSAGTTPSSPLPELAIDGTAYALWQRNLLTGELLTYLENYWLQTLSDLPGMELLTDFPRPSIPSFRGATLRFSLPPSLVPALRAFCQREGITSYMALLAAFQLLLGRVSDQEDIVVGTLVHGRTRRELEPLVGMFASTLVLRTNLAGEPGVRDVLGRVRTAVLEAYAHQDLPFARLVERLCPERDPGRHPLFQVLFQMIPDPLPTLVVPDLEMRAEQVDCGTAKFDLTLTIIEKAAGLEAVLEYSTDLFEEATIARLSMHYQRLLQALVSAPPDLQAGRLPLMGVEERERLLASWNERRGGTLPEACLHELFETQAMHTPEAVAIVDGEACLSYRELDEQANQLAHFLAETLHVRPGSYVGLMLRRSAAMVVGILGILKAGGSCVPLDPETPPLRLSALVEDAGLSALLCRQHYQPRLSPPPCPLLFLDTDWPRIAQAPRGPMPVEGEASARRVAMVLYTSGSTGRPKGVLIPHQAITSLVCPADFVTITPTSRIAQASHITFDAATFEIWGALLNGARLVILPTETLLSPRLCRVFLQEQGISILFLTTSLFHLYARLAPDAFGGLETLIFGGETVTAAALRAVLRQEHRPRRLVNIYGPTENTVCTTWYEVSSVADSASRIPIGHPIRHTQVYLLDRLLEPVPVGVPGELCIGGAGLALGYLNQPERTRERFIPHPFGPPGAHLYRSGDRVRLLPDGNFEFIERMDQQIKIRGHRIEPGEIETLLRQHPEVQDALVRVWESGEAGKQLVAYLVGTSLAAVASVRRFLEDRLPDFLCPSFFICLESLPLTAHGKVDVRALPPPSATLLTATADSTRRRTRPSNDAEHLLVELWQRLLGVEDVGIHDNFFTLGGHSLLAVQMIEQAHRAGLVISLQQFKSHPTIAAMARTATTRKDRYPPVHEEQGRGRRGPVPLTPGQQWMLSGMPWHNPHHNAPALLVQVHRPLELALVEHVMAHLAGHHDQLRARFVPHGAQWRQFIGDDIHIPVTWQDLSALEEAEQKQIIEEAARRMQSSMHLERGPLVQIACFCLGQARPSLLLWVVHHVLIDAYSFHVLLEDFQQGYAQCVAGEAIRLPDPSISGGAWAAYLRQLAASEDLQQEASAWMNCPWNEVMPLPLDFPQGLSSNTLGSRQMLEERLSVEETRRLFEQTAQGACTITDVLLSGLLQAWRQWTECPWLHVSMIDSGRLEPGDLDRSRSVGLFTLLRRFLLRTSTMQRSPQEILDEVHAQVSRFPNGGISLDLLAWAAEEDPSLHHLLKGVAIPQPHLLLNYLGEPFLASTAPGYTFIGQEQDSQEPRNDILECWGWTQAGQLTLQFVFSERCHRRSTIQQVADQCMSFLRALATGPRTEEKGEKTS